jgi:hypothetical protein
MNDVDEHGVDKRPVAKAYFCSKVRNVSKHVQRDRPPLRMK